MACDTVSNDWITLFFLDSRFHVSGGEWHWLSAELCNGFILLMQRVYVPSVLMACLELFLLLGIVWCRDVLDSPLRLHCQHSSGGRRARGGNAGSPLCFMDLAEILLLVSCLFISKKQKNSIRCGFLRKIGNEKSSVTHCVRN